MTTPDKHALALATLLEAITRALPAAQIKAVQQQQIVAAEELLERLAAARAPAEQLEAVRQLLENQRVRLSELRSNARVND